MINLNRFDLARHVIEVVARLEQLALAVEDFQCGTAGHLRLCANTSALGGVLPQLLAQYAAHHPDVEIDLEDALSEQAVRALAIGTAEVAIIGDNTPIDGLETRVAVVDCLVLIAPAAHSLAGSTSVAFDRTLNHNSVTLAKSASLTRKVSAAAVAAGRILRMTVQVS